MSNIALAIHGGAGTILKSLMTPDLEREYRGGLEAALKIGWEILEKDGTALEAVEQTVCALEDFPLFNAGRGAVFTHEGKHEMDASIMDGATLRAGAVGSVKNVKNPIKLARLVMQRTPHVLLAGAGANQFALEMGVEMADDAYFFTQHRYEQLLRAREEGIVQLDHTADEQTILEEEAIPDSKFQIKDKFGTWNLESEIKKTIGTVGAVACDANENLAAATSTGGMTNKKFGRVGDTPLIGAGTYADNATCAVSCTGHGEFFMLGVTAYDVAARMKYKGLPLVDAAREAIQNLSEIGGEGGLVAVDAQGNVSLPFNSDGMYRGFVSSSAKMNVEIYRQP
ncbi:MAG TPA: isoaspartyl peptidase/L-asparaginase [Pyrinomonadaceae bacterium]|nr:isoaspartyl peptidase/L-asparaginase [Pyrinomonadaceae bacterium]